MLCAWGFYVSHFRCCVSVASVARRRSVGSHMGVSASRTIHGLAASTAALAAASSSSDVELQQLALPPSRDRQWRLPGLPADGAFVRTLECQSAHELENADFVRSYAPGLKDVVSAASRMSRLQACVAEELSRWYHGVPASWVRPDVSSLWYSYTNVLQADGQPQPDALPEYPTSRLLGFILSPNVTVDAAFPHDTWTPQPYQHPQCNATHHPAGRSSEAYARARLANLREHCKTLRRLDASNALSRQPGAGKEAATEEVKRLWRVGNDWPYSWIAGSGETCHHGSSTAKAEADQRAYLRLLAEHADDPTVCNPGPLNTQVQVRFSVGMITGIFFTPELHAEAHMVRNALTAVARSFGREQNLTMTEAQWIPNAGGLLRSAPHGLLLEEAQQPEGEAALSAASEPPTYFASHWIDWQASAAPNPVGITTGDALARQLTEAKQMYARSKTLPCTAHDCPF